MRKAPPSGSWSTAALATVCPPALCLCLLILDVEPGSALGQPPESRQTARASVLIFDPHFHDEKAIPKRWQQLDKERRLTYHTRFLRQVARSTPIVEVSWKMEEVLSSLRFISENATQKNKAAAKVVGLIFSRTKDATARELCLAALRRIGNETAKREMLRIYNDKMVSDEWRIACAEYLQIAPMQ